MESYAEDDNIITTLTTDENSSESSGSEEEQSSITTENISEEKIDPWTTLINDAVPKVRSRYDEILQVLLIEGHNKSEAKEEGFGKIIPVFQKESGYVYMET